MPNLTVRAAATGLPFNRRAFLRGLTSLPLIGGAVSILGAPTAVAEPTTLGLMTAYKTWLQNELRELAWEMAEEPSMRAWYLGDRAQRTRTLERTVVLTGIGNVDRYHFRDFGDPGREQPSGRAALVLSTVGADWRSDETHPC